MSSSRRAGLVAVRRSDGGLGFVLTGSALLYGGAALLAAMGIGAAGGSWASREGSDYVRTPGVLTPPILPPPAAPVTREQLTRGGAWTPALMQARTNELARQYLAGRRDSAVVGPPSGASGLPLEWILAGAAALALLFALKR